MALFFHSLNERSKAPMKAIVSLFFLATLIILGGCGPKVPTTGTGAQSGKYSEDLSVWRPKVDVDTAKTSAIKAEDRDHTKFVEARHTVNASVDAVLDSIDRINLSHGVVDGFTIQFYSGLKREEALNVRKQLSSLLPELDADLQYVQPNFRVRAGKYINRIEAQKDYMLVKRHFPGAIIIPDRIPIREFKGDR